MPFVYQCTKIYFCNIKCNSMNSFYHVFRFYTVALSNIIEVAFIVQCTYSYKRIEEL